MLTTSLAGSFCLSESESGSDAFALQTRATPALGGRFKISGQKMWISGAKEAGLFLVFANARPEDGYKGITLFVVDAQAEGVEIGPKEEKVRAMGDGRNCTCIVMLLLLH